MAYYSEHERDYERRYEPEDPYYARYNAPTPPPRRYPSPRHVPNPNRRSGAHLSADPGFSSSGLHRSRSYGNGPRPEINIYNYQDQTADQAQRNPVYPPSPDFRGRAGERERTFADDFLAVQIEEMRLDRLARSRSRGRSDAPLYEHIHHTHSTPQPAPQPVPVPVVVQAPAPAPARREPSPSYYKWQLDQREKELKAAEQKAYWENEEKRMKTEFELKRARDDAKRKSDHDAAEEERNRIIAAHQLQRAKDDAKRKEEEAAAKEERKRIIADHEKELADRAQRQKDEEARLLEKIAREKRERQEREDREWREFELKQKERKEKAERDAKAEKEKIDNEMRARLYKAGYSAEAVEEILEGKKEKDKKDKKKKHKDMDEIVILEEGHAHGGHGHAFDLMMPERAPTVPVYAKIHKRFLDVETLMYYRIPWEWDRVSVRLMS